jgi:hypothetical protein
MHSRTRVSLCLSWSSCNQQQQKKMTKIRCHFVLVMLGALAPRILTIRLGYCWWKDAPCCWHRYGCLGFSCSSKTLDALLQLFDRTLHLSLHQ